MPSPSVTIAMINTALFAKGILGTTGTVYYVSSVVGSTNNSGTSPTSPKATLTQGLTLCAASKGDIVVLMPGHAETVNSAAFIAVAKIGVTIVGLGEGMLRPTFTWATDTAATITMTAASCRITNCVFDLRLPSALVSGIVISAAGCRIDNCLVLYGTAGTGTSPLQWVLTTAAANYLTIEDCHVVGPALTPTTVSAGTGCIALVGGTGITIQRNSITGWFTTSVGAISSVTTLTDNVMIRDNMINNMTTSATKGVSLLTGSTGCVMNNGFGIGSGAAPITGDAVHWARNWSAAAVASNGTLV